MQNTSDVKIYIENAKKCKKICMERYCLLANKFVLNTMYAHVVVRMYIRSCTVAITKCSTICSCLVGIARAIYVLFSNLQSKHQVVHREFLFSTQL